MLKACLYLVQPSVPLNFEQRKYFLPFKNKYAQEKWTFLQSLNKKIVSKQNPSPSSVVPPVNHCPGFSLLESVSNA